MLIKTEISLDTQRSNPISSRVVLLDGKAATLGFSSVLKISFEFKNLIFKLLYLIPITFLIILILKLYLKLVALFFEVVGIFLLLIDLGFELF